MIVASKNGNAEVQIDGKTAIVVTIESTGTLPTLKMHETPATGDKTVAVSENGKYVAYLTGGIRPWLYVASLDGGIWDDQMLPPGAGIPELYWEQEDPDFPPVLWVVNNCFATPYELTSAGWQKAAMVAA